MKKQKRLFDYFSKRREGEPLATSEPPTLTVPQLHQEFRTSQQSPPRTSNKRKRNARISDDDDDDEYFDTNGNEGENMGDIMEQELLEEPVIENDNKRQRVSKGSRIATSNANAKKAGIKKKRSETEERHEWLENIRDENGNYPDSPNYDPSTLFIPSSVQFTPFERQYWDVKRKNFDKVIFFKKGKFYELYENDADIGHKVFDLKMTDRVNMRMVGVPESSFNTWAAKFIAAGYKVGRVEQMESATSKSRNGKKVVDRKLCQVYTIGTLTDSHMICNDYASFLLSIKEDQQTNSYGICFVDASTGEFNVGHLENDKFRSAFETLVHQVAPKEIICERDGLSSQTLQIIKNSNVKPPIITKLRPLTQFWDMETTIKEIEFGAYFFDKEKKVEDWPEVLTHYLENPLVMSAFGGCVFYLKDLKLDNQLLSMRHFVQYDPTISSGNLLLDGQTLSNLEILANNRDGTKKGTLLSIMDHCITPFGKRMFLKWITHPLKQLSAIKDRQNAIDDILLNPEVEATVDMMKKLPDLERMIAKIHEIGFVEEDAVTFDEHADKKKIELFVNTLKGLRQSFDVVQILMPMIDDFQSDFLKNLCTPVNVDSDKDFKFKKGFPDIEELLQYFENSFDAEKAKETGFIIPEKGVNQDYDRILEKLTTIEQTLDHFLKEIQKEVGSRAVCYVHRGKERYLLEFPKGIQPPDGFIKSNQTKEKVRYVAPYVTARLPELIETEEKKESILRVLIKGLFRQFDSYHKTWLKCIRAIAELDCLISLAKISSAFVVKCRPQFMHCENPFLQLKKMVHPCVEMNEGTFIPNDTEIGGNKPCTIIVTGPNMGGKSTLLRQVCLAVIMAQMGCYIPAEECIMTPVDKIFTRIGANDRIMAGESTFMVELQETSNILRNATRNSLVILDELGRGTSTYDGMAIASSVAYYLSEKVECRTLFSTHYHLMVEEMKYNPKFAVYQMKCDKDENGRIVFLYKFTEGICPKSYGCRVAREAGIPIKVVKRASDIALKFEADARDHMLSLQERIQLTDIEKQIYGDLKKLLSKKDCTHEDLHLLSKQIKILQSSVQNVHRVYKNVDTKPEEQ